MKMSKWFANYAYIFSYKEYRNLFWINLMNAVLISMLIPVFPLWIVKGVGVSLENAFFLLSVIGIIGLVLNVVIGHLTDLIGRRKLMVEASMILSGIRAFLYSVFPNVALILATSWISEIKAGGLTFAMLQNTIEKNRHQQEQGLITSTVRTSISAGFILGPWVGVSIISYVSFSAFFVLYGVLYLGMWMMARLLLTEETSPGRVEGSPEQAQHSRIKAGVLIATVFIIVLLSTGSRTSGALLVLYVDALSLSWAIAAIISVGPIFEIAVIPLIGMLNDKVGTKKTLLLGGILGVAYFLLLSISKELIPLLLIQVFGTFYTAVLFTSLIIYVQDSFQSRLGFSSSLFFSGNSLSTVIGNALLGSVLIHWGYDVGFLLLGGITLLGVFAVVMTRNDYAAVTGPPQREVAS